MVKISFELEPDQALEYAQFLKRICRESFRQYARNEAETQRMVDASDVIRRAFAASGYAPR
jgi:hypothetical protein